MARNMSTDNYFVLNQGLNPLVNFNFLLRVELAIDLPCKSVKAFTREMEYELIQEGGLNDYVHMRRKPISKPFTLEIERYAGTDYIDPLPLGAELLLPLILLVSRYPNSFVGVARTYVFTGCTVTKKVYGELSADRSGILTDTITIAYREMICVDTAFSDASGGAIVGTGKATDSKWADHWSSQVEEANKNTLINSIDTLFQRAKERAEINRKYMETVERVRAEKNAELQALRDAASDLETEYSDNKAAIEEKRNEKEQEIIAARLAKKDEIDAHDAMILEIEAKRNWLAEEHQRLRYAMMEAEIAGDAALRAELQAQRNEVERELNDLDTQQQEEIARHEEEIADIRALEEERDQLDDELEDLENKYNEDKAAAEQKIADKEKDVKDYVKSSSEQIKENEQEAEDIDEQIDNKKAALLKLGVNYDELNVENEVM